MGRGNLPFCVPIKRQSGDLKIDLTRAKIVQDTEGSSRSQSRNTQDNPRSPAKPRLNEKGVRAAAALLHAFVLLMAAPKEETRAKQVQLLMPGPDPLAARMGLV